MNKPFLDTAFKVCMVAAFVTLIAVLVDIDSKLTDLSANLKKPPEYKTKFVSPECFECNSRWGAKQADLAMMKKATELYTQGFDIWDYQIRCYGVLTYSDRSEKNSMGYIRVNIPRDSFACEIIKRRNDDQ